MITGSQGTYQPSEAPSVIPRNSGMGLSERRDLQSREEGRGSREGRTGNRLSIQAIQRQHDS